MGTYETMYETKDGKTRRVKAGPPVSTGAPDKPAPPESDAAAEPTHMLDKPSKPAKQGA
jgi:hypothetical protein